MEWVETTAKTIEAAREAALDRLGVAADEAEFDVIEEPRPGLFGRMRGEARLRARVRPAQVRPKQERRRRSRSDKSSATATDSATTSMEPAEDNTDASPDEDTTPAPVKQERKRATKPKNGSGTSSRRDDEPQQQEKKQMSSDERPESTVTPDEVGAAAVTFMEGLTAAFGATGTATLEIDELELDVTITGQELGLMVGPGGRTLNAIQDLARVAAQRRLGDHETRLRIDVGGYRERREAALTAFANDVAEQVRSTGTARSLEPMTSADRKVVHDALNEHDGVGSRSVGEDPDRRIIVEPA